MSCSSNGSIFMVTSCEPIWWQNDQFLKNNGIRISDKYNVILIDGSINLGHVDSYNKQTIKQLIRNEKLNKLGI